MKESIVSFIIYIVMGTLAISFIETNLKLGLTCSLISLLNLATYIIERINETKNDKSN